MPRAPISQARPGWSGGKPGTTVLVLGAGLAGMLAAYELRRAGYSVRVLEYQNRSGGRNMTLRGGDSLTELGGYTQKVDFAPGNYINPGPWRIPFHHQAILHYCRAFGVALEPFIEVNHNAYLHDSASFGGAPQRYRHVLGDFTGYTAELLAKAINQGNLDLPMAADEKHDVLASLQAWGLLNKDYAYTAGAGIAAARLRARAGRGRRWRTFALATATARRDHEIGAGAISVVQHAQ